MSVIPTREQAPQIVRPGAGMQRKPAQGPGAGGPAITGKDIWRIIRKRIWLILISIAISTASSIVIFILWNNFAPFYTAEAYLKVRPPKTSELRSYSVLPGRDIMDRLIMSQAQMVTTEQVLQAAIRDDRIQRTVWYQKNRKGVVNRLKGELGVAPIPKTDLIKITMTGRQGAELAEIINVVAGKYIDQVKKDYNAESMIRIGIFEDEKRELQKQLDTIRKNAEKELSDTDIPDLQDRRNTLTIRLQSLSERLMQMEFLKASADAAVATVEEQKSTGTLAQSPEVLSAIENDGTVRSLKTAEENMTIELDNVLRKFGPKHRTVLDIETRLASIRERISQREKAVAEVQMQVLFQARNAEKAGITSQLLEIRESYNLASKQARDVQDNLKKLEELEGRRKDVVKHMNTIDSALIDMRLLVKGDAPVWLGRMAAVPEDPSMPKLQLLLPAGFALGVFIGFGLAFLLEFMDTSIKSPSDIFSRIDLPMLGMVPHIEDIEEEVEDIRLAFSSNPTSLIGEAFRQIRTCLLFSGPSNQRRSLLVTSPLPEDGRTTIAMNLAAAVAHDNKKVLVIDSNFRQPAISKLFPNPAEGGLSSVLVGQANWRDIAYSVDNNLFVLQAGPLPPNPAELLGSNQMRKMIAEMGEVYDQIIFDGAPCLVVTDSAILSTLVDNVLLVVRAGSNTHGIVQRTRDTLMRVGAHILGVVLNGVRVTAGGYLRKNYETFYEYSGMSQLPGGEETEDQEAEVQEPD